MTESVAGTTRIAGSITDASGNVFTLTPTGTNGSFFFKNGVQQAGNINLNVIYYHTDHKVYWLGQAVGTTPCYVFNVATNTFNSTTDPRLAESANDTWVTTSTGQIVMANGTVATLTANGGTGTQIKFNGVVDTTTANVAGILYHSHELYQTNVAGGWWKGTSGSWTSVAGDPRQQTGAFSVANGKVWLGGTEFVPDGINIYADELPGAITNFATGAPLTTTIPGLNFVRILLFLSTRGTYTPAWFQPYINTLTSLGIVCFVEFADYPVAYSGQGPGAVFGGTDLTNAANWYASMATAFQANPWVWFGTQNEPNNPQGGASFNTMLSTIYNAIRGTGAQNIILLGGGMTAGGPDPRGFDMTIANTWTKVAWQVHYYNWISGYSSDLQTVKNALATVIAPAIAAHSADGQMPAIIAEYGDSTDGTNVDNGWQQVMQAIHESGYGRAAYNYGQRSTTTADTLVSPKPSTLTAYGAVIKGYIQA